MQKKSHNAFMLDRAMCLAAIAVTGFADYGLRVPLLCGIGAAAAMLTELICLYLRKIPFGIRHLDAAITGVILVMLLPPTVPFSLLIISEIGAIIIGHALFGGRDHPMLPAAAVGYCIAVLSDRTGAAMFPAQKGVLPLLDIDRTALTAGISDQWNRAGIFNKHTVEWLLGLDAQPIGTCSIVLLAVIALVLVMRRSASAFVMTPMLAILFAGGMLYQKLRDPAASVVGVCLTNQTLFAVIFLYCDTELCPQHVGGMLYGLIAGGVILWFTRIIPVYDAPVLLCIVLNPVAVMLRRVLTEEEKRRKGGDGNADDGTAGQIPVPTESHPA